MCEEKWCAVRDEIGQEKFNIIVDATLQAAHDKYTEAFNCAVIGILRHFGVDSIDLDGKMADDVVDDVELKNVEVEVVEDTLNDTVRVSYKRIADNKPSDNLQQVLEMLFGKP
jgi:hypothetical protein